MVKQCYNLYYWFVRDNKKNQALAFELLDDFLELLDEEVDAHLVIEAIFVNNEALMRKVPTQKVEDMVRRICVEGHKAEPEVHGILVELDGMLSEVRQNCSVI